MASGNRSILLRFVLACSTLFVCKWLFIDVKAPTPAGQIAHPALLERITLGSPLSGLPLDARRYSFLQSRVDRDERKDLFDIDIRQGMTDFWNRFQRPFATAPDTLHLDEQVIRNVVDELMSFNGWAAAACSSLTRPFQANKKEDNYDDLTKGDQLYYFALVVHSADHFLIDQLAVIVQLSKRLGPSNIFVSLVDYASSDSTPFLCDLSEAVLILLGISFRIRRVPPMTESPIASYYPLEEAYTRNLALEPMLELHERRKVKFARAIWLKGFTCPNDILEMLRVSVQNQAAMTCSMDWKEHNGFFIYNDRWRTRDLDGNLFRGSKSTSPPDEAPPRDAYAMSRYASHLPFQVFCCESGTHIVDPSQSYYAGISYRSSARSGVFNISAAGESKAPRWSEGPCMDSSQMHFCRDLWMEAAREGVKKDARKASERERGGGARDLEKGMEQVVARVAPEWAERRYREPWKDAASEEQGKTTTREAEVEQEEEEEEEEGPLEGEAHQRQRRSLPSSSSSSASLPSAPLLRRFLGNFHPRADPPTSPNLLPTFPPEDDHPIPNTAFSPARILVNPRCVTTYAGVSHTQLAADLFGSGEDKEPVAGTGGKYTVGEWRTAPETFVCQEMRTTGGRAAPKQQRRTSFAIGKDLKGGWKPAR